MNPAPPVTSARGTAAESTDPAFSPDAEACSASPCQHGAPSNASSPATGPRRRRAPARSRGATTAAAAPTTLPTTNVRIAPRRRDRSGRRSRHLAVGEEPGHQEPEHLDVARGLPPTDAAITIPEKTYAQPAPPAAIQAVDPPR